MTNPRSPSRRRVANLFGMGLARARLISVISGLAPQARLRDALSLDG